ncbi:hypothetical protein LguiA_012072 [Lonicera macranthoides]
MSQHSDRVVEELRPASSLSSKLLLIFRATAKIYLPLPQPQPPKMHPPLIAAATTDDAAQQARGQIKNQTPTYSSASRSYHIIIREAPIEEAGVILTGNYSTRKDPSLQGLVIRAMRKRSGIFRAVRPLLPTLNYLEFLEILKI